MNRDRTALLIRCSPEDARSVRERAQRERRTIGGYLLNILDRAIRLEARLFDGLSHHQLLSPLPNRVPGKGAGTAMLLRCSTSEAEQIRAAAGMRRTSISNFVLLCLERVWAFEENRVHPTRPQPSPQPSPWRTPTEHTDSF